MKKSKRLILREMTRPRRIAGKITIGLFVTFGASPFIMAFLYEAKLIGEINSALIVFLFYLSVVAFIIWFREAYGTLVAAEVPNLKWSTGWALGGWLIPIANFVIPYLIAADIWKASDPDDDHMPPWHEPRLQFFVPVWWVFFVVLLLVGLAGTRMTTRDNSLAEHVISFVVLFLIFVNLYCCIRFVVVVNTRLDRIIGIIPIYISKPKIASHWTASTSWWHWVLAVAYLPMFFVPLFIVRAVLPETLHVIVRIYAPLISFLVLYWGIRKNWASGILLIFFLSNAFMFSMGGLNHKEYLVYLAILLIVNAWITTKRIRADRKNTKRA